MSFITSTARTVLAASALALALGVSGATSPAAASERCEGGYTVRSGDTLSKIAKRCGTSVQDILAANTKITKPTQIRVGWTLEMPGSLDQKSATAPAINPDPQEIEGRISNGRWCAQLVASDGQTYGLVGRGGLFRSGAKVTVRGHMVSDAQCNTDQTFVVTELERH
ncbi:MAG: LysM domain-containing protein [Pseudomonadota bacterium]